MTDRPLIPSLIFETKFKIQLGLIQSAQGDAGEAARAFAAAFDLLDQIEDAAARLTKKETGPRGGYDPSLFSDEETFGNMP